MCVDRYIFIKMLLLTGAGVSDERRNQTKSSKSLKSNMILNGCRDESVANS